MPSLGIAHQPEGWDDAKGNRLMLVAPALDVVSGNAHFRRWRLGFKQSGLRHITRALRDDTIDAFSMSHAFPPCCGPLPLSRSGQVGGPKVTSSRTLAP
jgi:hypothetical protein